MCCRLDYPGVGPEHSFLKDIGRAEYFSVTDDEALEGKVFCELYKTSWCWVFVIYKDNVYAELVPRGNYIYTFAAKRKRKCTFSHKCTIKMSAAFQQLSKLEGIIPALETSHALAFLEKLCPTLEHGTRVVLNCSGRGDKDVNSVIKYLKGKY